MSAGYSMYFYGFCGLWVLQICIFYVTFHPQGAESLHFYVALWYMNSYISLFYMTFSPGGAQCMHFYVGLWPMNSPNWHLGGYTGSEFVAKYEFSDIRGSECVAKMRVLVIAETCLYAFLRGLLTLGEQNLWFFTCFPTYGDQNLSQKCVHPW